MVFTYVGMLHFSIKFSIDLPQEESGGGGGGVEASLL